MLVEQITIPATGHTPVEFPATEPTCANAGRNAGKKCSKCDANLEGGEVIPALPHTVVVDPMVEATCTSFGWTEGEHCSVCEKVLVEQKKIGLKDHVEVVDKGYAATLKKSGKTDGAHCSVCGVITKSQKPINTVTVTPELFDELISTQPLAITSRKYLVQDNRYKSLYPDMLQVILKNNTHDDIRDAVIAFVAWDKNNLPVRIKGHISFGDGSYVVRVNYKDINMIPRATYGKNSGYSIDEDCNIKRFKAIVVSYDTFDGDTWNNPYYGEWRELYEGKRFDSKMSIDIKMDYGDNI